jgi:hypothetical protein
MPRRPAAVAFDVIETLMPLEPLRERFTAARLPAQRLELWFTRTLRDGIALAAAGDYAPFGEVAAQALRIVSGYQADDAAIRRLRAPVTSRQSATRCDRRRRRAFRCAAARDPHQRPPDQAPAPCAAEDAGERREALRAASEANWAPSDAGSVWEGEQWTVPWW